LPQLLQRFGFFQRAYDLQFLAYVAEGPGAATNAASAGREAWHLTGADIDF